MSERNKPKIRGLWSLFNFTQLSLHIGKSINYFETLDRTRPEIAAKFAKMELLRKKIIDLWK